MPSAATTTAAKLVAGASLATGYALCLRPRLLRWGATEQEVEDQYPGADLVSGATRGATMAVTIDTTPSRLWPWLVQMGCDRAGWYSWDRLDNGGTPSADHIDPAWQELAIGDHMAPSPSGRTWFEVVALEPHKFLALRASLDLRGRQYEPADKRPTSFIDSVWCFLLLELPEGRTRLVVSGYTAARPRLIQAMVAFTFWEPAHWVMQMRQFANLKRRAESYPASAEQLSGEPTLVA